MGYAKAGTCRHLHFPSNSRPAPACAGGGGFWRFPWIPRQNGLDRCVALRLPARFSHHRIYDLPCPTNPDAFTRTPPEPPNLPRNPDLPLQSPYPITYPGIPTTYPFAGSSQPPGCPRRSNLPFPQAYPFTFPGTFSGTYPFSVKSLSCISPLTISNPDSIV